MSLVDIAFYLLTVPWGWLIAQSFRLSKWAYHRPELNTLWTLTFTYHVHPHTFFASDKYMKSDSKIKPNLRIRIRTESIVCTCLMYIDIYIWENRIALKLKFIPYLYFIIFYYILL